MGFPGQQGTGLQRLQAQFYPVVHDTLRIRLTLKNRFDILFNSKRKFLSFLVRVLSWVAILVGDVTFSTGSSPGCLVCHFPPICYSDACRRPSPKIQSQEQKEKQLGTFLYEAAGKEYPRLCAISCEPNFIFLDELHQLKAVAKNTGRRGWGFL
jgi:hypothetical protein